MRSIHKNGNYWSVLQTITIDGVTKRKWINLGVRYDESTRAQAEKKLKEMFGSQAKAKTTLQKIEQTETRRQLEKQQQRDMTSLSAFLSNYLNAKEKSPKIKSKTLADYKRCIERFIDFTDDCFIDELDNSKLEGFSNHLSKSMTKYGVDRYLTRIKAFLNWIEFQDTDNKFPKLAKVVRNIRQYQVGEKKKKTQMSNQDYKRLLSFLSDDEFDTFLFTYYEFARSSGVRLKECLKGNVDGNRWQYVGKWRVEQVQYLTDEMVNQWYVLQNFIPKDEDGLVNSKTIDDLAYRVSQRTTTLCRKVLLYNNPEFLKTKGLSRKDLMDMSKGRSRKLGKRLLCIQYAKKLGKSYSELTEADKKEATTYGISFHSIRHLYITEQAELHGKDNAQVLAGHTNLKTTEGYVHSDQYERTKQLRQQQPN